MSRSHPLRIIIVGAGLGGCAAAFCFARNGHEVKVLEQRPAVSHTGGGIMVRPPASKVFISWGLGPDFEAIADTSVGTFLRDMRTGKIATRNVAVDVTDSPDWGTDREATQKLLYDQACKVGADFHFDAAVKDVYDTTSEATVVTNGGTIYTADLVLAADGIRSRIRRKILTDVGESTDPVISNITLYGVRHTIEDLRSDPKAKTLIDNVNLQVWMGKNLQVVARTSKKLARWGAVYGIVSDETDQKGLWDEDGDIEYVRKAFADTDPALQAVLALSKSCDRWKLAEMPDLPRWTSSNGRIALLGDSAHAMLPNAAHGFSQIVEDIAVLEYLTERDPSKTVPNITRTWQSIRIPRVNRIKEFAAWNTRAFLGEGPANPLIAKASAPKAPAATEQAPGQMKSLKTLKADSSAPFHTSAFLKWAQDYDAVAEAQRYVEALKAKI